MVSLEEVKNLIRNISQFRLRQDEDMNMVHLSMANEIQSSSFFDATYKIIPLCRHSYRCYHYDTGNRYYDVFIYEKEEIDVEHMLQLILCDNYAEIPFRYLKDLCQCFSIHKCVINLLRILFKIQILITAN